MDKINEVLAQRVKRVMFNTGISQADVARSIGEKPQTFGNYVRGRTIPAHVFREWKKVYKEDLEKLSETEVETNVSHGTNTVSARDIVESENYIGMHRRVYDTLEKNMDTHRILMMQMSETIKNLTGNQGGSPGGKQVSLPRE